MKKKLAVLAGVALVAAALIYWFGIRDRSSAKSTPPTPAADDPWDRDRPAAPVHQERPTGPMPELAIDTDPAGHLRLEGQVLDEHDAPVGGAVVTITSSPPRTTTTDSDGSFAFDKLLGRTYAVRARSRDKIGGPVATKVSTTTEPVVIRLRVGAVLTVTVTDAADHHPVVGAEVALLGDDDQTATTGKDGVAHFKGLGEGWVTALVTADGYGPGRGVTMVARSQKTADIGVALVHGAAVSGRVVDEAGAAIGGARVWAVDAANGWSGGGADRGAVESAKDGSFTIPALAPGSYLLMAKDEEHAPAQTAPISVAGQVETTGVEIVMKAAAVLAGTVVTADGQPAPYAGVQVSSTRWSFGMVHRRATADDRGTFVIKALPRTPLKVRAESEDASSEVVEVDLAATPDKRDLRLVLDVTGTIAGIVVDGRGEPVPEASVSAYPDFLAGGDNAADWILASNAAATTDGGGRFTLRGLDEGAYRLWASRTASGNRRDARREGTTARTGDRDVRLVLPSPGTIVGKLAREDGSAPELAVARIGWEHQTTARDGEFRFDEVQPGTYDVRVTGVDFAPATKGDVEVVSGKTTDLGTITVRRGRRVLGKVVDAGGEPVVAAKVVFGKVLFGDGKQTAPGDEDRAARQGMRLGTSGDDGEFVLTGVPRTRGVLIAEHPELGRSVALAIPAGEDDVRGLVVTLRGYGSVAGTVTRKGEPVAGAAISAAPTGSSGQAVFVTSGADGAFVIDKVPAGRTTVQAMKQAMMRAESQSRVVEVVAGERVDGSIDLPVGDITLTVTVTPRAGDRVDAAQVFLFRGAIAARTAEDIMNAFLANGGAQAAEGASSVSVQGAAGMVVWISPTSPPEFTELVAGDYTVCAIPITGAITDTRLLGRVMANLDKLEVVCKRTPIPAAPRQQTQTLVVPQMVELPPDGDDGTGGDGDAGAGGPDAGS